MKYRSWKPLGRLLALTALVAGGCKNEPPLAEVSGTVKSQGKLLANVLVEFHPESVGVRSSGVTDAQGHYVLKTDKDKPGAVVGNHKVVLKDLNVMGIDRPTTAREREQLAAQGKLKPQPPRFPARYSDLVQTPINKEVKPNGQSIDLDIIP